MTTIQLDPALLGIAPAAPPAAPKKSPSGIGGWLQTLLIIAAIIGCFLWINRGRNGPTPVPPGPNQVASVAEQASRDYAVSLAAAMNALAKSVDSGEISNAEQLKNNARAYTQAAREKSFGQVDRIDTDSIPAGDWTTEQRATVAAHLRSKALGHEKASK